MERIDLTGRKYGTLTVLGVGERTLGGDFRWKCQCECGKIIHTRKDILKKNKSCGCIKVIGIRKAPYPIKHGRCETKEYRAWVNMKRRCVNPLIPEYKDYGARGIKVYGPWMKSFSDFLAHIGTAPSKKHSLERINNDKGYEPGNVKWATYTEQSLNKRNSIRLEFQGETKSLDGWCEYLGVSYLKLWRWAVSGRGISDFIAKYNIQL